MSLKRCGALVMALALGGCGGTMLLKSPVADQCKDAGLKGCDALTEGVLGYVEGDKEAAKKKLAKGAAENDPAELASFAAKLKTVSKLPGLDSFGAQLTEVAGILEAGGGASSTAATSSARASSPSDAKSASNGDDARVKTSTAIVAGHPRGYACSPMGKTSTSYAGATCVRLGIGPLVVTDVVAGSACVGDVLVLSGAVDAPSWVVAAAPRERLDMHGARLAVAPDDELVVAVRSSAALARDASCGVTVSSRRP